MGSLLEYSGITTKIRSMKSQLLTEADYEQLAQMSTVREAVEYLKKRSSYDTILSKLEETTLHRSTIEQVLFYVEYSDFIKIYRFSNNVKLRNFLDLYFLTYEAKLLKTCIRCVVDHRNLDIDLEYLGEFFEQHSSLDFKKISEVSTIRQLVEALKDTPYYTRLHPLCELPNISLFDYETAVDAYVFSEMWRQHKKYKGVDRKALARTFGYKFDLLNLQWIYRAKKYYNMSTAEIYNLLLPIQYKLNKESVHQLVEAATPDEFMNRMNFTYYGKKYASRLEQPMDGFFIEKIYHGLLLHAHVLGFRNEPFSIATVHMYLYLKHIECARLITTLEGIRYGFPIQTIIEYSKNYNLEVLSK